MIKLIVTNLKQVDKITKLLSHFIAFSNWYETKIGMLGQLHICFAILNFILSSNLEAKK